VSPVHVFPVTPAGTAPLSVSRLVVLPLTWCGLVSDVVGRQMASDPRHCSVPVQ
jgi:hypothetical protein